MRACIIAHTECTLACVSSTAFGLPVVPLVSVFGDHEQYRVSLRILRKRDQVQRFSLSTNFNMNIYEDSSGTLAAGERYAFALIIIR